MLTAQTLRYYGTAPPLDPTTQALVDTGCIPRPGVHDETAGLGAILGGAVGSALGTFVGPAGTALGGTLGGALGGVVENVATRHPQRRSPKGHQRPRLPLPHLPVPLPQLPTGPLGQLAGLAGNERRILEDALKAGSNALLQDAVLRVLDPQRYESDRILNRLPSQQVKPMLKGLARWPLRPFGSAPQAPAPDLAQAVRAALAVPQQQPTSPPPAQAAPATQDRTTDPPRTTAQPPEPAELTDEEQLDGDYYDTGAPQDRRPRPRRHISLIPLQRHQLEAIARAVTALEKLDLRLIKLMAGTMGARAHDTSGVDAAARIYHAEPGETTAGIAKKLTGDEARVPDLLAANPGRREGDTVWRIPPGWLSFDYADTGAPDLTTQRKYVVQEGDSPIGIATKLGAKPTHPRWWSELKKANPQKETTSDGGNWTTLWAGEEIGIPDDWPPHPLAVPTMSMPIPGGLPPMAPWPGIPNAPAGGLPPFQVPTVPASNSTMDPGVMLQAQGMLALWRYQHPAACQPSDFGLAPTEFTGTPTPRTTQAIQSFQVWWNQQHASTPLRIDGTLDDASYKALYSSTIAVVPAPPPLNPQVTPVPSGPQIPVPGSSAPPTSPPVPGPSAPTPGPLLPADFKPGAQVPGLPPGWSPVTPSGPYGMPWQAPTPPPSGNPVPGLPPGWTSVTPSGPYGMPWQAPTPQPSDAPKKSDAGLLPLGLGLLAALMF